MTETEFKQQQWRAWDGFLRRCYFVCFAVVAMATIGLAVLAEPLAQSVSDQESLRYHEQVVADLVELQQQQSQLLANSNHPAVIERVAIHHLKYQPAQAARAESLPLPQSWRGLDYAVAGMGKTPQDQSQANIPGRQLILALAQNSQSQWLLFAFGSALAVISLCFFCTPKRACLQEAC